MRLRIDEITAEAREVSFLQSEEEVNRRLAQGPVHEFRVGGAIAVDLSYYRAGMELFFEGRLSAPMVASCARCAEEFSAPNARPFRFVLAPRAAATTMTDGCARRTWSFRSMTAIRSILRRWSPNNLSSRSRAGALCREDCQGLCPSCGINLNLRRCDCEQPARDPRLAVLRTLKLERS